MNLDSFDFDEWATLAESAPDTFEVRRREIVEYLIANGRNIRRLRGLQCRIDMERMLARTAMKSCLRISSLMWDSFLDYQSALDDFICRTPSSATHPPLPKRNAKIIYLQ
jgi:hypothetical protein